MEKNTRILIVDDDSAIREVLQSMLESDGHTVASAPNGRIAMRMLGEQPFDAVITDLVMPEQEGIETIKQIVESHPGVKIVAMSGAFGGDYLRIASLLGAHSTLRKPLRLQEVLETVSKLLS
jgi:DNA-binding NtrC family response regulator